MKTIIFLLIAVFIGNIFPQNITNTLGTSGLFRIRDNATIYLTLQQSDGLIDITRNLRLANVQGSQNGVIFKGTSRFLHNYAPSGLDGNNIFLGIDAGNFTMSGTLSFHCSNNIGIGTNSLSSTTSGYFNTAIGSSSQQFIATGNHNTSVGINSLFINANGSSNTGIGANSLLNTTGDNNTALGYLSGFNILTGSNNICIGNNSQPTSGTVSNQITFGNNQITSLRCNVTTISSLSDARDKKNITDLSLGLDFITKLKPRQFNWDKREWYEENVSDGTKMQETPTAGFIAQELDEIQTSENAGWLNLVLKDNPEKFEATPGNLLPVMVKAIQELKAENDKLKAEIESLKTIEQKLAKLEQMIIELNEIKEVKSQEVNSVEK